MPSRFRTKSNYSPPTGVCTYNGTPIVYESLLLSKEDCTDVVDPGNGHPLTIDKHFMRDPGNFPRSSCTAQFFGAVEFIDFPIRSINDPTWFMAHLTPSSPIPSVLQAAAKVAADTNPSRPHVDLPVAIGELRNLKDLFIKRTNQIGRDIASGRLALEYGYRPLINDIVKLASLGDAYVARVREIKHLRRTGLRRKRTAYKGIATELVPNFPLQNLLGSVVTANLSKITTVECVVFIRWVYHPLPDLPGVNDGGTVNEQAAAAILGWTPTIIDGSTLWELMGFSWFFDWWSNVGDVLAANRNTVGAYPDKIQVMYHTKTEQVAQWSTGGSSYDALWSNNLPVTRVHETKTRTPTSLAFESHLPLLSAKQISILADIMRGFK